MAYLDHKDGAAQLTSVERAVQYAQEQRNCMTCLNLQIHKRGGARVCCEDQDTGAVLAGAQRCEYYR